MSADCMRKKERTYWSKGAGSDREDKNVARKNTRLAKRTVSKRIKYNTQRMQNN